MPIRIMHVVDNLGKGGLENGLVNLTERLDPERFEHVVYALRSLGPNAERLKQNRVRVICHGKQDDDFPLHVAAIARGIRAIQPDIVHSRNWAAIEAVLAARWVRSCAVVHGEHGLEANASAREPWRRVCFRRLSFELADRVLSVSYQLRDLHARRTGFDADRITVIHNGVDSRRFASDSATRARVRAELGLAEREFCIGCVGNLFPVKDHMCVLKALDGFSTVCPSWRLLLIGDGPERPNLERFAGSHPAWRERVSFLGTSHRVPELLNAMDVYVLPSLAEGISNSLLEAMASGLPVVVTATGGSPEVVVDGDSGLLFPEGDFSSLARRLASLAADPDLRLKLARQAVRRVREEFSLESMVRKYEQVYESLGQSAAVPIQAAAGA